MRALGERDIVFRPESQCHDYSVDDLRLEVFDTLEAAETVWRTAEAAGIGYGFVSFEWMSTWQRTVGTYNGVKPYIVRVVDASCTTAMIVPLGIRRVLGCKVLGMLGGQLADYQAPILSPDFAKRITHEAFAALWTRILDRLPPVDLICLERQPESIEGVANPFARLPGLRDGDESHFAVLDPSFQLSRSRRHPGFRRDTGRRRRRLAELGTLSFRIATAPAEIASCMAALFRQRLEQGGEPAYPFTFPAYREFYQTLALQHCASGLIQLSALYLDDKIVATHWGMVYRGRFYYLCPAFERGPLERYSPGRLLLEDLLEWAIANSISVFDLTIGDEAYKARWTDRTMALFRLEQPQSVKGLVLFRTRRCLFGIKDRVRRYPRLSAPLKRAWLAARLLGRGVAGSRYARL